MSTRLLLFLGYCDWRKKRRKVGKKIVKVLICLLVGNQSFGCWLTGLHASACLFIDN